MIGTGGKLLFLVPAQNRTEEYCAAAAKQDNRQSCLVKNCPVVHDPRPRLYDKRQVSLTNGFADVLANRLFAVRVRNDQEKRALASAKTGSS